MNAITNYISCACNYHPHAVDWGTNGLICYASSNSVVIYDPNSGGTGKVLKTLYKHSSLVKSVQWVETNGVDPGFDLEILSGSLDGTILLWTKHENDLYKVKFNIDTKDHLMLAQACYLDNASNNKSLLVCGAFSHDTISVWHHNALESIDKQEINLKKKIPINIKFSSLPGHQTDIPIIIVTTEDDIINLLAWDINSYEPQMNFVHIKELKGHEDWIQALDVIQINEKESLIASGSQDGMIRLWKLSSINAKELSNEKKTQFSVGIYHFDASLESILSGHDHWVYGLHWHPKVLEENRKLHRPLKLLSCALDKTMLIWEPSVDGVWVETVKLGKIGGNAAGYYGCRFSEDGCSVLAHGYQGTFHIWTYEKITNKWLPRPGPSGHFSDVTDLAWEAQGRYLITTSHDQTTRVHVPWRKDSKNNEIWHEIGRPQIHGYNINTLAILTAFRFASGADEKVVRIFEAPTHFVEALETEEWKNPKKIGDKTLVPALGLTNKVVHDGQTLKNDDDDDTNYERPPTEEEIIRHSLWPELEKLYGHGYEIFAMASTHNGNYIATACKSSSQEHAAIILWSMKTFSQIQKLISHRLTVTQLDFSPDDKYLVSVSRDRAWCLYSLSDDTPNGEVCYRLITIRSGAYSLHSRVIWCCSWTHDSRYFATGSRDGKIGFWNADELEEKNDKEHTASLDSKNASVTALAFSKRFLQPNIYVLAIGYDDGVIRIQKIIDNNANFEFIRCVSLDTSTAHHKTVKRLEFRPQTEPEILQLASCSSDRVVKIYTFVEKNTSKIVRQ